MIGIHLQDGCIKKKETWIDEITRDVRTLLKTAEWKRWALEREIRGAKFEEFRNRNIIITLIIIIIISSSSSSGSSSSSSSSSNCSSRVNTRLRGCP
jgi:hypothetical protein